MTTWAEATTAKSSDTLRAELFAALAAEGVDLAGFDDASPQRVLVELQARASSAEQQIRVAYAFAAFLSTAARSGSGFVDRAVASFDLSNGTGGKGRILATKAQALWRLTAAAGAGAIVVSARELKAQANDGKLYTNVNAAPVTVPSGGSALCLFEADVAGAAGNQNPGAVTKLVTAKPGLSVSNAAGSPSPSVVVTARDAESDDALIARALGRWATLGAGWTRPSFDYWIPLASTSVTRWDVDEANPQGPGTIEVILANAAGPATGGEIAAVAAKLGAIDVKPLGTGALTVSAAVAVPLSITASIVSAVPGAAALVQANLDALLDAYPLGPAWVRVELVRAVLMGGEFDTVTIERSGGLTKTLRLDLPGVPGITGITSCTFAADLSIASKRVLVPTVSVT